MRPLVRTYDEALLYLQLQPCDCGARTATWESALTHDNGAPARTYHTTCVTCGIAREYTFRLPARPLLPPPDTPVLFGGDEPSELFDAGEWLRIADITAGSALPVDGGDGRPRSDEPGRQALQIAIAAMDEVLKFLPAGSDAVPDDAFRSDLGRRMREVEAARFGRTRLEEARRSYRERLHPAR